MLRLTLANAWSRKRRLAGTGLAVVLGIAFLVATLVFGDSARAGFSTAFAEANAGTDALVRSGTEFTGAESSSRPPIPASLVDEIRTVDGVAEVAPVVDGTAQVLDADGDTIGGNGPPTMGAAWIDDPDLTGWDVVDGRAPEGPGEAVIDRRSAEDAGVAPGDTVTVLVPDPVELDVVGVVAFGEDDSIGGSTYVAMTLEEAQRLLLGSTDLVSGVVVAAEEGVSEAEIVDRLDGTLPPGVEAITGTALTEEMEEDIEGDFLGFFTTALLVFAVIALLVASLSIYNTFSILVAQRTRESALLRAIGASRRQVLVSAAVESLFVGAVGAVVGAAAGIGLAAAALAAMESADFGLPLDGMKVTGGTLTTAAIVGIGVTLVAGAVPAFRASRTAPIAALRETAAEATAPSKVRAGIGFALGALGAVLLLTGNREDGIQAVGLGAVLFLVALVLLGPVFARPVAGTLGAPLRLRGVAGDLARRNAVRNPRRTAAAATALLVGVGVVTLFAVIGASVSKSIEDIVDENFGGDLVLTPAGNGFSGAGLATSIVDDLGGQPEVAAAAGLGFGPATVDGRQDEVGFTDAASMATIADFDLVEGDIGDVGPGDIAVSADYAEDHGYAVGDIVTVGFPDGGTEELTLVAVYDSRAMGGDVLVDRAAWAAHDPNPSYFMVMVDLADGVGLDEGTAAVEALTAGRGAPDVMDRDEFIESQAAEIDVFLTVIYALLLVAILIALMGIANTLSLAVHERTRELGLLRAVGQTRSQLRAMVRWESVLVSTFGAIGGTGLGVFLGWAVMRALRSAEDFGSFALPTGTIVAVLVIGAVAGVLAGLRPAWRASKLDVLQAVAAD